MTSPRRAAIPPGIPAPVWALLLADIYCVIFTVADLDCVSVKYSRKLSSVVVCDPHQHIYHNREELRSVIKSSIHDDLVPYVSAALLGD
jgi:hypothetical protein